jgi:hypothetical protein
MSERLDRSAVRATVFLVLLDAAVWTLWLVGMVVAVAYMERTFRDYALKVPAFTETVLAAGRWLDSYWYACVPVLLAWLALDGGVGFALRSRERTRRVGQVWSVVMFAVPLLAVLCSFLSLWLPLLRLWEGLSR